MKSKKQNKVWLPTGCLPRVEIVVAIQPSALKLEHPLRQPVASLQCSLHKKVNNT